MVKIAVGVRKGIDKEECDDTALVGSQIVNDEELTLEIEEPICVGVADGVGGNKGGKDASLFVMEELSRLDFTCMDENLIKKSIRAINDRLLLYAHEMPGKELMATTLSAIWLNQEKSYLMHVGNSRIYAMRGAYLKQLTKDHTTYQWLLDSGQNDAADSCNKNEILSCMGGNTPKLVERLEVEEFSQENKLRAFLITSDGIHEYVDIDDMEDVMGEEIPDIDIIHKLIEMAESNGSSDDKTVLILRFI